MNRYALHHHAASAHAWLRPRLGEDGAWQHEPAAIVDAYQKVPWWLAVAGDRSAAERSLAAIESRFLQADGDLSPVHDPQLLARYPLMPHAYVILGASLTGRLDVANRLLDLLAGHQHRDLGGWGDRVDHGDSRRVDAISSAALGLAFLEAGRLEPARDAAGFLERLLAVQPSPATHWFTTLTGSGDLLTEFTEQRARIDRQVILAAPYQVWHALGFPIMLLARLYEREGDGRWLEMAEHFVGLLDQSEQAWIDLSAGKVAWGCAVLYRATGNRAHRRRSLRALRGLVSWQDDDGGWLGCLEGAGGSSQALTTVGYDVNTELAAWLSAVGEILAEADGATWTPPAIAGLPSGPSRWLGAASRAMARRHRLEPVGRRLRRSVSRIVRGGRPAGPGSGRD